MLKYLANYQDHFGPLRLFDYASTRVVMAAITSFIAMMLVMPPLIRWLKRKKFGETGAKGDGAVIVDAMRDSKKGTPTMGGLGLVACIVLAVILWCDPGEYRTWLMLFGLISFAVVGFLDDRTKIFKGAKGTPLWVKLSIQISAALACGIALYLINEHYFHLLIDTDQLQIQDRPAGTPPEFYKKHFPHDPPGVVYTVRLAVHQLVFPLMKVEYGISLGIFSIIWVVLVMTSCANGVNFTDGMDGLAAGTMFIAALAFMVIAYVTSRVDTADYLKILFVPASQEVAVFCAAVAGACLGFLWFNCAPAEVFMGDTGSQALGGALGLMALNTMQEFLLALVGFIFVIEAGSVALQIASYRLRGGKRIFLCAPLHHHFQYKGWPESKIVLRFWIVAALAALIALATLKLH